MAILPHRIWSSPHSSEAHEDDIVLDGDGRLGLVDVNRGVNPTEVSGLQAVFLQEVPPTGKDLTGTTRVVQP